MHKDASSSSRNNNSNMFAVPPMPIFSGDVVSNSWGHTQHRPSVSSPLSSSPIRATSPLSPASENALNNACRQTQSSPLSGPDPASKFLRYASRTSKPNPRQLRREEAQESRRKLFLQNVRQRADDRSFQRRDVEGKLLKSSWDREMRQRVLEKQMAGDALFSEADIDDAAEILLHEEHQLQDVPAWSQQQQSVEEDEMMVDEMVQQEEHELEAMFTSFNEPSTTPTPAINDMPQPQPPSPTLSDDDEYDAIFMSLVSDLQINNSQPSSQQMDMS